MILGIVASSDFTGGGGDPYFANVVTGLHMDGMDGSTTFTDIKGRAWTANGNSQIDTAFSKFGGASGLFDGSGDYITAADSADFYLPGDFCIDFWLRGSTTGARQFVYGQGNVGATTVRNLLEIDTTGRLVFHIASSVTFQTAAGVPSSTFKHIAVTRNGTAYNIWIDGSSAASTTNSGDPGDIASPFSIGRCGQYNGLYFNGHADDFRLTKGVPRYTAGFSPPSAAFPDF